MELIWIVFVGIGLFMVGALVYGLLYEHKRSQAWQELAQRPGFRFLGKDPHLLGECGHFRVFQSGHTQSLRNMVALDAPAVQIRIGDFSYVTGSGKNRTTHYQTVCVLQSDTLQVPHCYVRPERRFWDAIGSRLGMQDIDFDEDPEFSAAFVLQGDDEEAVRRRFDANVRAWFSERAERGVHFEARDNTLVLFHRKRIRPEQAPEEIDQALQIMKRLQEPEDRAAR